MGRTNGTAEGDMRQFLPGSETRDLRPSTPGMAQCHPRQLSGHRDWTLTSKFSWQLYPP